MYTVNVQNEQPKMTESQRKCLAHVLRNTQTGFSYLLSAVENREISCTTSELESIVESVIARLEKIQSALSRNTFCVLESNECEFVGPHIGCRPPRN